MIYPKNFEDKINFTPVKDWLKELCRSSLGVERVDAMQFSDSVAEIERLTGLTEEFRQIILMESSFPDGDMFDIAPMLHHIGIEGTYPSVEDVFALRQTLDTVRNILSFLKKKEEYPLLSGLTEGVDSHPLVIKAIDRLLDDKGMVRDNASPALAEIRREIAARQSSITRIMQRVIKQAQAEGLIEDGVSPSMRDGRMVIPVVSSMKRKISGIVHDESATGRTSYIEPAEVVAASNALRELTFAERREITRLLTAFADMLRPQRETLASTLAFAGDIDFIRAKASLALRMKAVKPIIGDGQAFRWLRVVHPVMAVNFAREKRHVEPQDIVLTPQGRILVISGPNAGGKSVCLKTTGLVQYMLQCGLLVPMSENSEAGVFRSIFIDIGDEQSIDNDLSTYSSHLLHLKHFVRYADERTLILIDEFGTGTDPVMGGALAEAVLERINAKGAWGVVTTHYGNLKHYAANTEGVINGAMLYDRAQMRPLFRLEIGKPGSSFAFEMARRIGFPEDILERAADSAGRQNVDMEKNLRIIERDKQYWENKRRDVRQHAKQLDEIISKQLTQLETAASERKTIIETARREAEQILADANRMIEQTIRTIKETQAEREATRAAREQLKTFKEQSHSPSEEDEKLHRKMAQLQKRTHKRETPAPAVEKPDKKLLAVGDTVRLVGQDAAGEVVALSGNTVTVAFGSMKSTVDVSRLARISKGEYKQTVRKAQNPAAYSSGKQRMSFKSSIDVRGLRTEEALMEVERLLDEAAMLDVGEVKILHGKGNGILREMIRQYLSASPVVSSFADEDIRQGGTGITVVRLD